MFTLYVPVVEYGAQCEPLAESLEPHDLVLITGKLAWTKKPTKAGEKAGLAVTTFNVEVLSRAPMEASTNRHEGADMPLVHVLWRLSAGRTTSLCIHLTTRREWAASQAGCVSLTMLSDPAGPKPEVASCPLCHRALRIVAAAPVRVTET
jgi:hypothetical protein